MEVNERLVMEDDDDADGEMRVLLKMQMREGENRTQRFALMLPARKLQWMRWWW